MWLLKHQFRTKTNSQQALRWSKLKSKANRNGCNLHSSTSVPQDNRIHKQEFPCLLLHLSSKPQLTLFYLLPSKSNSSISLSSQRQYYPNKLNHWRCSNHRTTKSNSKWHPKVFSKPPSTSGPQGKTKCHLAMKLTTCHPKTTSSFRTCCSQMCNGWTQGVQAGSLSRKEGDC